LARADNISWSEEDAGEAINYLVKTGKLKKLKNPLWKNKIDIISTKTYNHSNLIRLT